MNDLPHCTDSENIVLASLLQNGSRTFEKDLKLHEELFLNRTNKIVFRAIYGLFSAGLDFNLISVTDKIKSLGSLDDVGGIGHLSKIASTYMVGVHEDPCLEILHKKFALRSLIESGTSMLQKAYEGEELTTILDGFDASLSKLSDEKSGCITKQVFGNMMERMEALERGEMTSGLRTGIPTWDKCGGIIRGRQTVIAARPGVGKTSLVEQTIDSIIQQDESVLIFQNDMSPEMMVTRMCCRRAGFSFSKYELGKCSPEEYVRFKDAGKKLNVDNFIIYSPRNLTPSEFVSVVRKEKRKHGIKCVVLDHILSLQVSNRNEGGKDLRENISLASKRLVGCLRETDVAQVIISQLNREGSSGRPKPSQIMQFDGLLHDCDLMLMMWRKDDEPIEPGMPIPVKITVGKNRFGPSPEDELMFDTKTLSFR